MNGVLSHSLSHAAPATVGKSVSLLSVAPSVTPGHLGTTADPVPLSANATGGVMPYTYSWSGDAELTYSNAAVGNPTVTAAVTDDYLASVTVTDADGQAATASVVIGIGQVPTTVVVTPATAAVPKSTTQQFAAVVSDQFGHTISSPPAVTWSLAGGGVGSVSAGGLYAAPSAVGSAVVVAEAGGLIGAAGVTVADVALVAQAVGTLIAVDGHGTPRPAAVYTFQPVSIPSTASVAPGISGDSFTAAADGSGVLSVPLVVGESYVAWSGTTRPLWDTLKPFTVPATAFAIPALTRGLAGC